MSSYAGYIATLLIIATVTFLWNYGSKHKEKPSLRSVAIVVLGDIGRSPRMMYHAESFGNNDFDTHLFGYRGSNLIPSLLRSPRVRKRFLWEVPKSFRALPFPVLAPIKLLLQITTLLYALLVKVQHPPEYIMVQNPPSIPTLAIVWLVCKIRGSKLIIDWHNLGYTILALRFNGRETAIVKVAKQFEAFFGRRAYLHLFVTKAMRDKLSKDWGLIGSKVVLHDRPPAHFHRSSVLESHELFSRLFDNSVLKSSLASFISEDGRGRTPFTCLTQASRAYSDQPLACLLPERPALLISSTSWTSDERFDIFLEALQKYEKRATELNKTTEQQSKPVKRLPKVLVLVTGKGEEREKYMSEVMRLEKEEGWQWVRLRSLWLEPRDYPTLLGSADLGVCMHASSSKLDLPMKVVDMFGCGLPVCALDFDCLDELVKEERNGYIFHDSSELAERLEMLLAGFPAYSTKLQELHDTFAKTMKGSHSFVDPRRSDEWEWSTWSENWDRVMKPQLIRDVERDHEGWS